MLCRKGWTGNSQQTMPGSNSNICILLSLFRLYRLLVRETINQYISTIDILTNNVMEDNKELLDILSKEENLDAIYDIANNKNIVVNRIINEVFIPKLRDLAESKGLTMGDGCIENWFEKPYVGLSFYNPQWKYLKLVFEFEDRGLERLIFGFHAKDEDGVKREDVKDWEKVQKNYPTKDINNQCWIWKDFNGNQDWDNASGIKDLLNGKTLTDFSLSLQKNATQSHKLQNNQGKSMIAEDSFVPLL